jgi:hypothetical protein
MVSDACMSMAGSTRATCRGFWGLGFGIAAPRATISATRRGAPAIRRGISAVSGMFRQ